MSNTVHVVHFATTSSERRRQAKENSKAVASDGIRTVVVCGAIFRLLVGRKEVIILRLQSVRLLQL